MRSDWGSSSMKQQWWETEQNRPDANVEPLKTRVCISLAIICCFEFSLKCCWIVGQQRIRAIFQVGSRTGAQGTSHFFSLQWWWLWRIMWQGRGESSRHFTVSLQQRRCFDQIRVFFSCCGLAHCDIEMCRVLFDYSDRQCVSVHHHKASKALHFFSLDRIPNVFFVMNMHRWWSLHAVILAFAQHFSWGWNQGRCSQCAMLPISSHPTSGRYFHRTLCYIIFVQQCLKMLRPFFLSQQWIISTDCAFQCFTYLLYHILSLCFHYIPPSRWLALSQKLIPDYHAAFLLYRKE